MIRLVINQRDFKKCIFVFLSLFIFNVKMVWGDRIYEYITTYESDQQVNYLKPPLNTFMIKIDDLLDQQRIVEWMKTEDTGVNKERYVLDEEWATLSWNVLDEKEEQNYKALREGNQLLLKGMVKNQVIDKVIEIDDAPFYFNPKLGLRHLVISGKEQIIFWAMRHDNLKVYKMMAEIEGVERIAIMGKETEVYRVRWSALRGLTKYFERIYWFRVLDGVYVKQKVLGNKIRILVDEQL